MVVGAGELDDQRRQILGHRVAERLGVGPERLRGLNPRLIYCGISGFGNDGPWKDRPAFDTVSQAVTGFLRLLVNPANPRVVGPAIGDAVTGFYAAFGVLAALYERRLPRACCWRISAPR